MKKFGLLNQPLMSVIAGMGHMDTLVIADAGLPIPAMTTRIDLAVLPGLPSFMDVVQAVLNEMAVEGAVIAAEMIEQSPAVYEALKAALGDAAIETVPHTLFKARTAAAQAVVRTGEFTPFANVILLAGVVF